jgi:heme exporter protein A
MPPLVEVDAVSHAFGERVVLRDVALRVEPGASLALFGPNGSGKSTLLRAVAGLLRPVRGTVRLDGESAHGAGPEVRRRIGYVGHRPLVWGGLTPRENLTLYARLYEVEVAAVEGALERVGLARRADEPARELSQGMGQRLGIARALLHAPDVWVLDEPHASLDEQGEQLLDGLIRSAAGSATVVLATHDRERGRALCGATATLDEGSLAG